MPGKLNPTWQKPEEQPKEVKPMPQKLTQPTFVKDEEPAKETKPVPQKLAQPTFANNDNEPKVEAKPVPKKMENTFEQQAKQAQEMPRSQTVKQPASKPESENNDDFKSTLAAMLARGQGGRQGTLPAKKAEPVVEEVKEKIKLNVFEDDDGAEETKVQRMIDRQQNLASEETDSKMAILPLEKQRRASKKLMVFDSDDDE